VRQKDEALRLRAEGKTQEEAAAAVGVDQRTVDRWEQKRNDRSSPNASPDLRYSIPKSAQNVIHERAREGEKTTDIAADFKISIDASLSPGVVPIFLRWWPSRTSWEAKRA